MYVNIINGETSNLMIQEKEQTKNNGIFGMADSAVILKTIKPRLEIKLLPRFLYNYLTRILRIIHKQLIGCSING